MRGHAWSRLESVRATQDEFRFVLEDPALLTSYSWRRLGNTVGLLAGFTVPQLAALGDWGELVSDSQAKMPIHYAGSGYGLVFSFPTIILFQASLRRFRWWDNCHMGGCQNYGLSFGYPKY